MSSLRVTVNFIGEWDVQRQSAALAALAGALRNGMADGHRLTRRAGLHLPGGGALTAPPDGSSSLSLERIFVAEMPDGDAGLPLLRELGGWFMRTHAVDVALKADGPGGGVSLRMTSWSAVAWASAAMRIQECLRTPSADEGPV